MPVFVLRRLVVSVFILLVSSFLIFFLVANSGDPLGDLRTDTSPNREQKIEHRIEKLHLDQPVPQRYMTWLGGVSKCAVPGLGCDLGQSVRDQDVSVLLSQALSATLQLVTAAIVLSIILGVTVGVVSSLRQYSGFDYTITFTAFLFFSLPVFWVAVLLKQYLAIEANDWYDDPKIGLTSTVVLSLLSGLFWGAILGGKRARRWIVRGTAAVLTAGLLQYLSAVEWFQRPALGPALIALLSFGTAVGLTALLAGLHRRNVLYGCLTTAAVGSVVQFPALNWIEDSTWASWTNVGLLALGAIAVAAVIGYFFGGLDRGPAIRACVLTALFTGAFMVTDILLRTVPSYSQKVNGRILATTGAETPDLNGTFWQNQLDQITHLILPTLAIMLISFATYSRYSRATMLDVMNQDYVRTARAKGLTERTVVVRHAFRNALIPLTTLAAVDLGVIVGGAVITEKVFARRGMGSLFVTALDQVDPNPVMGFYIVTAVSIVVFNMLADIAYAYLDPRIRLS
ncbi:MAG: glutathione transport system permease protein [Actinomycetota bacterium]|nr:glutathione transport system permease protein [Actinomycetota bacterium]